jgi:hypothetical protein
MLRGMKLLFDSFWRALAYVAMPRVIGLSLLPLLVAGGLSLWLGYLYWEAAVAGVRSWLENWVLTEAVLKWLGHQMGESFRAVMAPLIVVALVIPVVVVVSLLLVSLLMSPALVRLVAERRFAGLQRRQGASVWRSLGWSLSCTAVAMGALVISAPLWLIPPFALIVPPMIWGWLTAQVMAFDALADHASAAERTALLALHRWPLMLIGMVCGALGAAPSLLWALSATTLIFAPFLLAASVWLYTLVFAFSSLWFVHYGLAALQQLRQPGRPDAVADGIIIDMNGH